jgi:small GTP-binding protein
MDHIPTVFDHYICEVPVHSSKTILEMWDLSGKDEH